jgi:hypothetical protein
VSVAGLLTGNSALVVGVEDDDETGCLRMYVGARHQGIYALIEDEDAKDELRRAWANVRQHVLVARPPESCLYTVEERP